MRARRLLYPLPEVSAPIDIIYAAHTGSCTFLLDSEGICRRIVMVPNGKRRETSRTAARCVGAQYVASLDGSAAGGLVEMPRVGAAMLFARVDERGRVSLVRTGVVTSFESKAAHDPFVHSGTVETSAPDLVTPRVPYEEARLRGARGQHDDDHDDDADDCYDASERTQRIHALRPEDIAAALGRDEREHNNDLTTDEYETFQQQSEPAARTVSLSDPYVPTLRNPHRDATIEDDDEDDYARATLVATPAGPPPSSPGRGMLPRRSDPHLRAAAAVGWSADPRPTPRAEGSDIQVSRRRRG